MTDRRLRWIGRVCALTAALAVLELIREIRRAR